MPNLDLPIAGYDDPIVGNTDYALPVAAPIPQEIPRVYINSPGIENRQEQQPILKPVDHNPWSGRNPIKDLVNAASNRKETWIDKTLKEAITGAHDVMTEGTLPPGLRREDITDIPAPDMPTNDSTWLGKKLGLAPVASSPADPLIEKAQAISALAGTGGLAGTTDATLGATPFLRPALKYKEKLYKGKEGQQHMDVIPPELYPEFQKMAMSGEDISHYNFGFHNDKGQFLSREKALEYGINTGIIDPQAGKFGALTSTLMADSSKPGVAIEAMAKAGQPLIIRGTGAEIGHESLVNLTKPDHYYRGMSEAEYNATIGAGKPIKSNESSSFKGEGTNFSHDARDAESYANFGRSDPRKTGTPNYLVEVKGSNGLKQWRDGYFKAADEIHPDRVTSVIKMEHDGNGAIIGKVLKADSSKEAAAIQSIKEPFFSALEHNVSQIKQSKMTGDQWLGTLSNKPGVKPEELDWTGLKGFLEENKGKLVTKAQIEEHLANNKVELKEVSKGASEYHQIQYKPTLENDLRWFDKVLPEIKTIEDIALAKKHNFQFEETVKGHSDKEIWDTIQDAKKPLNLPENLFQKYDTKAEAEAAMKSVGDAGKHLDIKSELRNSDTKYHSYQLPGGENYREMLLTTPIKTSPKTQEGLALTKRMNDGEFNSLSDADRKALFAKRDKLLKEGSAEEGTPYKSSHWDEPNILAHVRMNDRNINGKKSLHLEEIQSDWHQQGRDKGYRVNQEKELADLIKQRDAFKEQQTKLLTDRITKADDGHYHVKMDTGETVRFNNKSAAEQVAMMPTGEIRPKWIELDDKVHALQVKIDKIGAGDVGVPDAPFKKSWHELALKRMIREAAEKGYDRLSWTPGEAQAARYDLSKSIDTLKYSKGDKDAPTGMLVAKDKNGGVVLSKAAKPNELADIVGKEAAKKLLEQKFEQVHASGTGYHELSGADLKIGGEGMKGFYDQIIPKALEKLGKEHGVKVKTYEPKKVEASPEEINKLAKTLYETYDRKGGEASWENLHPNKQKHYLQTAKEKAYLVDNPEHRLHYIDIPKSLKDTAMHKGFPLFSKGVPIPLMPIDHNPFKFKPVDGNPFEDEKK